MPEPLILKVNGAELSVLQGTTVAVALTIARQACRISVSTQPRGPLCGMGICFECRATINGKRHRRSCQIPCEAGMDVSTDE
ncbi:MAG TPA: (2Fe-2S)-binding protein [Candidatus Sulfotelmatobacter sp.]|nr:(2Fe-2S)-binding protein [Candidatus Sulfotelmatobacter sp.]